MYRTTVFYRGDNGAPEQFFRVDNISMLGEAGTVFLVEKSNGEMELIPVDVVAGIHVEPVNETAPQ